MPRILDILGLNCKENKIMDRNFTENVSAALSGDYIDTNKHGHNKGYFVSIFIVDSVSWEVMHKGKRVPDDVSQVYAIRPKP